jgi:hypothetical protein
MRKVLADKRFKKVRFDNYDDWDKHPRAVYECPFCKEVVTFCFRDFDKHRFKDYTNLTEDVVTRIDAYLETIDSEDANSYLDFACQGCHRPVRIYYTAWAGGRHCEYGHIIRFVIEEEV